MSTKIRLQRPFQEGNYDAKVESPPCSEPGMNSIIFAAHLLLLFRTHHRVGQGRWWLKHRGQGHIGPCRWPGSECKVGPYRTGRPCQDVTSRQQDDVNNKTLRSCAWCGRSLSWASACRGKWSWFNPIQINTYYVKNCYIQWMTEK